jgi:cytochrome P450
MSSRGPSWSSGCGSPGCARSRRSPTRWRPDERHYENPDRFQISRNPTDHLAFGNGIHTCVGAPLARLEVTSVLRALAERATTLEPDGDAVLRLNNTTRGFSSAPVRMA